MHRQTVVAFVYLKNVNMMHSTIRNAHTHNIRTIRDVCTMHTHDNVRVYLTHTLSRLIVRECMHIDVRLYVFVCVSSTFCIYCGLHK